MKYLIFISLVFLSLQTAAQTPTVISPNTPIETVGNLSTGTYRYFTTANKDTVDLSLDKMICPVCPTVPVCPPCPVCPPAKQRTAIAFSVNKVGQVIVTYDNGNTTMFTLTQTIIVK